MHNTNCRYTQVHFISFKIELGREKETQRLRERHSYQIKPFTTPSLIIFIHERALMYSSCIEQVRV
jgi:hypothetical protein